MRLYDFDPSGVFIGESDSDICQITGDPIMRINSTDIKPPKVSGDSLAVWMGYKWGIFTPTPPAPPTIDDLRSAMVVTKVKAMQNLKRHGALGLVLDFMDTQPRDSDIRILWDYSEALHRLEPTLVKFCKEQMGLDDTGIDNLFL